MLDTQSCLARGETCLQVNGINLRGLFSLCPALQWMSVQFKVHLDVLCALFLFFPILSYSFLKGNFPFFVLFYHSSATWGSKILRKGNVKLAFPVPICDLSPCFYSEKQAKERARGRYRVLLRSSLNCFWRHIEWFLKTRTPSFHVSFLKELEEEGIDKYTAFPRQTEQLWKTVGSQAVSYLKKKSIACYFSTSVRGLKKTNAFCFLPERS